MKTIETLPELCESLQLEISSTPAIRSKTDEGWEHNAYTVTVKQVGHGLKAALYTGPWKAGLGIKGIKTADVMHSLLMDARVGDQSFEHWCADYGYSDDSIKVLNSYRQCQQTRDKLLSFFDQATLEQLFETASNY